MGIPQFSLSISSFLFFFADIPFEVIAFVQVFSYQLAIFLLLSISFFPQEVKRPALMEIKLSNLR